MIPMSGTAKIIVVVILSCLIAGLQKLGTLEASWTWLTPLVGALVYIDGIFTAPPPSSSKRQGGAACVALFLGAGLVGAADEACTPAQGAEVEDIVSVVANDVIKGDDLQQIDQDVATILCNGGLATDAGTTTSCLAGTVLIDIGTVVDDALALLTDSGSSLPTPAAKELRASPGAFAVAVRLYGQSHTARLARVHAP